MNKNNNIINHGTFNLAIESKKVSFNIDLKYEQCDLQRGNFRVTVLMGLKESRFIAGHFLLSISQFGKIGQWIECDQFDSFEKLLIEETIVSECMEIYKVTELSLEEFLNA
jgi:hypothetical protein